MMQLQPSISILDANQNLLRFFQLGSQESFLEIFFHPLFGFVTGRSLQERQHLRKSHGFLSAAKSAEFSITVENKNDIIQSVSSNSSEVEVVPCLLEANQNGWLVKTLRGDFYIASTAVRPIVAADYLPSHQSVNSTRFFRLAGMTMVLALVILFYYQNQTVPSVEVKTEESLPPVIVVPQIQEKAVTPPAVEDVAPKTVVVDSTTKAKKVLSQNLGFLQLLGKKEFKKAMGGLKTKEVDASAGAGAGGNAGSGGEMLAGVGQGLRQTTVGNSGIKGLGGVGTQGAGGGAGGYGTTLYAGGGGGALSTVPLSQQATVQGGLDRSVIQATILRYLSQIRACYEEGLKSQPEMIGQITTDFEINAAGNLNHAKIIKSALNHPAVENCIESRMMNWKFPRPRGGVQVKVVYPFMLRPMKP